MGRAIKDGTLLQKRAAKLVSEVLSGKSKLKSKREVLEVAGYTHQQALRPSDVTESKGFLVEMAKLGLTKEFVVAALQEDIALKPQRRAFELSIAGKWLGLEVRDKQEAPTMAIHNAIIVIQQPDSKPLDPPQA